MIFPPAGTAATDQSPRTALPHTEPSSLGVAETAAGMLQQLPPGAVVLVPSGQGGGQAYFTTASQAPVSAVHSTIPAASVSVFAASPGAGAPTGVATAPPESAMAGTGGLAQVAPPPLHVQEYSPAPLLQHSHQQLPETLGYVVAGASAQPPPPPHPQAGGVQPTGSPLPHGQLSALALSAATAWMQQQQQQLQEQQRQQMVWGHP